jgi:hypothetical protein
LILASQRSSHNADPVLSPRIWYQGVRLYIYSYRCADLLSSMLLALVLCYYQASLHFSPSLPFPSEPLSLRVSLISALARRPASPVNLASGSGCVRIFCICRLDRRSISSARRSVPFMARKDGWSRRICQCHCKSLITCPLNLSNGHIALGHCRCAPLLVTFRSCSTRCHCHVIESEKASLQSVSTSGIGEGSSNNVRSHGG